jgi:hypothetical protein
MMQTATGGFSLSFGVAGILLTLAALTLMLKDLSQQMAEPAEESAQTKLEPVPPQPRLDQIALR